MSIHLGNQTISDLERRTGYIFSDKDIRWLESHRQDSTDIKFDSDKFHIFDIPFEIHVAEPISDYLVKLLTKYEEIQPSKEQLQIAVIKETDEQRKNRLEKERKEKEWQNTLHNPNAVWNIKWHMLVPVRLIHYNGSEQNNLYYWCFINTYTTGRDNIPEIIDGTANILLDELGFHGKFKLYNNEIVNDADKNLEYQYVIGSGSFYNDKNTYISNPRDVVFDNTTFNIKEAINRYKDFNEQWSYKEIHFNGIKEEYD